MFITDKSCKDETSVGGFQLLNIKIMDMQFSTTLITELKTWFCLSALEALWTENYYNCIAGQKHNIYKKVSMVTELWKSPDRQKKVRFTRPIFY
jgi:hypothetical protein